MMAILLIYHRI